MSSNIEEREAKLWTDEAKVAERINHWFDVLISLRKAADAGVSPDLLVEQIRRIDPDMLWSDSLDVIDFMYQRFDLTREDIEYRKKQRRDWTCPYTQAEYDAAVAKVGTRQKTLAHELKVSRNTLAKWGRPAA